MAIATHKKTEAPLNIRERLAIKFLMIIVQLLAPWEYSHQYDKVWADIKKDLGVKESEL
jgi:hypothetical protein